MQFTPRICNGAAHDLAKMALKANDYVQWWAHARPICCIFFLNLMKVCFLFKKKKKYNFIQEIFIALGLISRP